MPRSEDIYLRITGTHTDVDGAGAGTPEVTTLQFPTAGARVWLLTAFHYKRSGGTASNYAPSLHQTSAATSGGIAERMSYASTVVGTAINDVFAVPVPCMTDSSGRLYFKPGYVGASTDNDGAYEFWFKKGRGATKAV